MFIFSYSKHIMFILLCITGRIAVTHRVTSS